MMGTGVWNSSDGLLTNPSELYARRVSSVNLDLRFGFTLETIRKVRPRETKELERGS